MRAIANKGFGNGKATLNNGYGLFLNISNTNEEKTLEMDEDFELFVYNFLVRVCQRKNAKMMYIW